ncbi:MAG TPA: hypothetical protein PKE07_08100 [Lacibacter sp.]|nr:hypothetical protein [Lacibacter sp.]HMO89868.1 hypothetical protein [Lacibacter sp.]
METKKYIVMIDDNYDYMDEDARYKYGEYDTPEEAILACKKIVERSIELKAGATANELYASYLMFGEDPFIEGGAGFNAREYAREYLKSTANTIKPEYVNVSKGIRNCHIGS